MIEEPSTPERSGRRAPSRQPIDRALSTSAGAPDPRSSWKTVSRNDFTFSRRRKADAERALASVKRTLAGLSFGATILPVHGIWEGREEFGYRVSIVGWIAPVARKRIVSALHLSGCEAVQIENWEDGRYACHEMRPRRSPRESQMRRCPTP